MNALKNLAISETGFIFDPGSGNTFVVNETALLLLKAFQNDVAQEDILSSALVEYDVDPEQLNRDFSDFKIQMQELGLHV